MPLPNSPAKPQSELETLRARYQKGLLAWLKAPETGAGLIIMSEALADSTNVSANPLWPSAQALLAAIQRGKLPPRVEYRRLAGRVDQALRRAAQGEQAADPALLQELQDPLAQLDPQPQAPIEALIPRGPLAHTLAATAAILPLMAQDKEPRFKPEQRKTWDQAVELLSQAWEKRPQAGWSPLRKAVFQLLEGALPLNHPAPLKLAEALATATDPLDSSAPSTRLLAALTATLELLREPTFLEHKALEERIQQLVHRLNSCDKRPRAQIVDRLFSQEAVEEIEHMRHALESIPPCMEALLEAAQHITDHADTLDQESLVDCINQFTKAVAPLAAETLDHPPNRQTILAWLSMLEQWVVAIGNGGSPPADACTFMSQLQQSLENQRQPL